MKKRLSWIAWALVLAFAALYVARRWDEIRLPERLHWGWLAAGSCFMLAGLLAFARVPQLLLRSRGFGLSFRKSVALSYVATLGKYVPGKVWSVVGALWLYHREGIPRGVAAGCLVATMLLSIAAGGLVGVGWGATGLSLPHGLLVTCSIAVALAIFLHSPWFRALVLRLARRWPQIAPDAALGTQALLEAFFVSSLGWVLCGIGFGCVVLAMHDVPTGETPKLVALFAFAQTAGFLALFAPAGLGVREGILAVGLTPLVGEGEAILIAGFARVWQTALELILAGAGWWILRAPATENTRIPCEVEGITAP